MSVNSFENERRRVAHRSAAASVQLMKDLAFKKQSLSQVIYLLIHFSIFLYLFIYQSQPRICDFFDKHLD